MAHVRPVTAPLGVGTYFQENPMTDRVYCVSHYNDIHQPFYLHLEDALAEAETEMDGPIVWQIRTRNTYPVGSPTEECVPFFSNEQGHLVEVTGWSVRIVPLLP